MRIRVMQPADWSEWLRMSLAFYPGASTSELESGMRAFAERRDAAVFIAERASGLAGGFVEIGTRAFADGCHSGPVPYIEAWYVDPDMRRRGIGRALLDAAERWAREAGHHEIASDALLDNEIGRRAHERAGYREVGRVAQYRKSLDPRTGTEE
jgi:aminoglycoside 6'-N-acetyltransferase I